ncbi:TolC family protein [uncultured Fretibacterium sp.]|uniref:TolC family protein n=1 Tax=uncultured Fretibacterium sp. TaxID=1678694 RepID=UPI0026333D4C|nr:TolC family protein [uncultured Fretibacterium sp.]
MRSDKRGEGRGVAFPAAFFCMACVAAALFQAFPARGEEAVRTLTLEECLALSEANHPDLAGADAKREAERRRLSLTAVEDRVQASANASAARSGREGAPSGSSYTAGVTASVRVFDANRTKYAVEAQRGTLAATEAEGRKTRLQVRYGVKKAYMDLLLAGEVRGQRKESVDSFRLHLERAKGYYETGLKPKSDVTKAEVDLGNAQLALVEAESNVRVAQAALLNAMGVDLAGPFEVRAEDRALPESAEGGAEALALEHRQDYEAANRRTLAGKAEVRSAARASSPSLSLRGGYSAGGEEISSLSSEWNVGLSLNVPVVDGGAASARTDIARAQVRSLEAAREALRQNILLEVRKAVLNIRNARERIRIAGLTVAQAEENYSLAEGRYRTGVGDSLALSDALLALTDARLSVYRARYDLQVAQFALESATGVELTEPEGAE